jgi:hypothetical protein
VHLVGQSGLGQVGGDVGKDASEVGIDEPGDRMEDDVAIRLLLEGAIAGERMQVDTKVRSRSGTSARR